jgi:hypothetical protein
MITTLAEYVGILIVVAASEPMLADSEEYHECKIIVIYLICEQWFAV